LHSNNTFDLSNTFPGHRINDSDTSVNEGDEDHLIISQESLLANKGASRII